MELRADNFINVQAWMVTELGLTGDELLVYAIIFGMTQDGESWYYGGRNYLCKWLGCSDKKAGRLLKSLYDQDLLVKEENRGKAGICYKYQAKKFSTMLSTDCSKDNRDKTSLLQNDNRDKSSLLTGQNVPIDRDKTSHIIINKNINTNKKTYMEELLEERETRLRRIKEMSEAKVQCPDCKWQLIYSKKDGYLHCPECSNEYNYDQLQDLLKANVSL